MLFPSFRLSGEVYERMLPATIAKSHRISRAGTISHRCCPSEGFAIEQGDAFYACPRASVFYGTALDAPTFRRAA
ncbi:hypothetical protein [Escherichia coli]|uniref:hypothetical protein n=1 Tax=Escherichia coli TaxID=562 RepID=UPI0038904163